MSAARVCATCSAANVPLQQCARCKSASYCNKSCQKANWKAHKQACARHAQDGRQPSIEAKAQQPFTAGEQDKKPFTAIDRNVFLHDRTEEKTYQLLIDTLRMRQEDEYTLNDELMSGTIYNQEPSSENAFRTLIRKAKAVPGLLPPWWDERSTGKCLDYARDSAQFSLAHAQEKHDIQETWGDTKMPMKLRMLAERVYGNTPGGHRSDAMLGMMMGIEGDDSGMSSTTIDLAALMRSAS